MSTSRNIRPALLGVGFAALAWSSAQGAPIAIDLTSTSALKVTASNQTASTDYELTLLGGAVSRLIDLGFTNGILRATATGSNSNARSPRYAVHAPPGLQY